MNLHSPMCLLNLTRFLGLLVIATTVCLLNGCSTTPVVTSQAAPVLEPPRPALSAATSTATVPPVAAVVTKHPEIFLPETSHHFGKVKAGSKVEHAFLVINAGEAPLAIKAVRTSCGCTTAGLKRRTLEPGELSELNVTFDVGNRRGERVKRITITSNDPQHPKTILTISADVLPAPAAKSRSQPTARAKSATANASSVHGLTIPERSSTQRPPTAASRQPSEESDAPIILRKPRP